jgi:PAS domain S-box-containing protein
MQSIDMTSEPSRATEQRLRVAVDWSPSGLLMTDARGAIVLANREIERLFGYAREELLGRSVEALVPERFRHTMVEAHEGVIDLAASRAAARA